MATQSVTTQNATDLLAVPLAELRVDTDYPTIAMHELWDTVTLHLFFARRAIEKYEPSDALVAEFRTLYLCLFERCKRFVNFVPPDSVIQRIDEEQSRELEHAHAQGLHDNDPTDTCDICAVQYFPDVPHASHPGCTHETFTKETPTSYVAT